MRLVLGLVLGFLMGVGAAAVYVEMLRQRDPCLDRCGAGTLCLASQCKTIPNGPIPDADLPPALSRRERGKRPPEEQLAANQGAEGDDLTPPPTEKPFVDNEGRPLEDSDVDEVFFHHRADIERCITDARGKPISDEIQVKVSFRVDPSGRVAAFKIEAPKQLLAKHLGACVRNLVEPMRFPPAGRSTLASYTFGKQ